MAETNRAFNSAQESLTKQNIEKVTFLWTIENFSYLDTTIGTFVLSSEFTSNEHKWQLKVYPGGKTEESKDYLGWFLWLKDEDNADLKVKAKYQIFILSPENEALLSTESTRTFEHISQRWGYETVVKRSDLLDKSKGYLADDKLKLGVELVIIKDVVTSIVVPRKHLVDDSEALTKALGAMYDYSEFMNSKELSDVEIINQDGKTLKAHKIILARNSIVLATAFKNPMKETNEGQVTIGNIGSGVLTQMLQFMYSGKLEEKTKTNVELLSDLLTASDLYEVTQLKITCGILLLENMTSKNVLSFFGLGETYRCLALKEGALEFIVENQDSVLATKEWKVFEGKNPQFAILILHQLRIVGSKRKSGESSGSNSKTKKTKLNI